MIPSMDNPLLSHLVNGISSSVPQSRLYSSWSVCDEETNTPSITDCLDKSDLYTFSDSEKRTDVFGLRSGLPDDQNKSDAVTDWESLSRLFPPLWAASDHQDPSVYVPTIPPGSADFSPMVNSQMFSESARNLPDIESLQRGFEDLGLLDPLAPRTEACNPLLEDVVQDLYYDNQALDRICSIQPIERPNQYSDGYVKLIGRDCGSKGASICPGTPRRAKEFSGLHRPVWKNDKGGRGRFNRGSPTGQANYSPGVREAWAKEAFTKSPNDFSPVGMKPPAFQFNQPFPKNHGFQPTSQRTPYKERSENNFFSSFPKVGNFECHDNVNSQKEPYAKSPIPNLKPNEGFSPSSQAHHRWLEGDLLGSQKSAPSPLPSPASSTLSDGSPTHIPGYFSQPALPPSAKEGQMNGTNNQMAFSSFNNENQRRNKCFGCTSPNKEAVYQNPPLGCPPNWSPPQQGSGHSGNSERLPKSKRLNPQNNVNAERRGRRPWNMPPGNFRQNPPPCSPLQRKQEANLGNVSDFINASLLPPFSLISDLKQAQNFPPFNPQVFSPPTNVPFPPPFPFSDLIDLFHYEDINQIHPFISDLFCGDIPPPYFPFHAPFNRYRSSRNRSGPANELHLQLEECCEQWRALEKERKKAEADLARNFPGNRIFSSYSSTVPALPANPSRVDRLVVDQLREHSRAISLVKIMERICAENLHVNISLALEHHLEAIHLTQARRKDEIVNAANRQKQGAPRYNNERDVLALAAAMKEMVSSTRKARTALWCALQMTLSKSSAGITVKPEDLERALQELCPNKTPNIETEPRSGVTNGGRE
ncbi:meiosis-specific coiled-coil domain-containing protein MEIOC [Gastrophryne carolinensis]